VVLGSIPSISPTNSIALAPPAVLPGDGPAAADAGGHPAPRARAAGLGAAPAHTEARRGQPRGAPDRQHGAAPGRLQVPVHHAAGPGLLGQQREGKDGHCFDDLMSCLSVCLSGSQVWWEDGGIQEDDFLHVTCMQFAVAAQNITFNITALFTIIITIIL